MLKKIGYGILIAFDCALLLFVIWTMLDSFAISYGSEQVAVANMVVVGQQDLHSYTVSSAAFPIEPTRVVALPIGNSRYDFYTKIINENKQWRADFTYKFVYGGGETEELQGYIHPNEAKPVSVLAQEISTAPGQAEFVITDVNWYRVNAHTIRDYDIWYGDRTNFEIETEGFEKDTRFEGETFGRTTFTIKNKSPFSYYNPRFHVLLKRGSAVVGVNRTTLTSLDSGKEEVVTINWFGTLPAVSSVEVIPEINFFDLDSYKPLVGESPIDTRLRVFR